MEGWRLDAGKEQMPWNVRIRARNKDKRWRSLTGIL